MDLEGTDTCQVFRDWLWYFINNMYVGNEPTISSENLRLTNGLETTRCLLWRSQACLANQCWSDDIGPAGRYQSPIAMVSVLSHYINIIFA